MNSFDNLRCKLPLQGACALITSPVNRRYFSGFASSDGYLVIFENESFLLVDSRYFEAASNTVQSAKVLLLEKASDQLNELYASHGIKSVYIESDRVTVGQFESMKSKFKDVTIDFSDKLYKAIRSIRMLKTPEEITSIKTAQAIAESALKKLFCDGFSYDNTEKKLACKLDYLMRDGGADDISFETILLSGEHTSMPHGVPSGRSVCDGDALLFDFGAVTDGYHSDMTRTAFINRADSELKTIWDIVLEAKNMAMEAIKPGIPCNEIDKIARGFIASKGYGDRFGHGLGHSVGLEIHEYPAFNKTCTEPLAPGMIMTVEPGIYIPGKVGVRIEDMVVITETGYENLASMSILPEFTVNFL
jgi:Xaa-Pro aminopeptidase